VLAELFAKGGRPAKIMKAKGLQQISDPKQLRTWVTQVLEENSDQVAAYLSGNAPVLNWLFGQVVKQSQGKANPERVRAELHDQLAKRNTEKEAH
jgi:glutaminyl-tRNA synthetase